MIGIEQEDIVHQNNGTCYKGPAIFEKSHTMDVKMTTTIIPTIRIEKYSSQK